MRKDSTTAKLTDSEIERNKKISKVRDIACPVELGSLREIQQGKNSILGSAIFMTKLNGHDLQPS